MTISLKPFNVLDYLTDEETIKEYIRLAVEDDEDYLTHALNDACMAISKLIHCEGVQFEMVYDGSAGVFVVTSPTLRGLVVEAGIDSLIHEIRTSIEDLKGA